MSALGQRLLKQYLLILPPTFIAVNAGAWLCIGPWVLPGRYTTGATVNDMLCGLLLMFVLSFKLLGPAVRSSGTVGTAIGVWLLLFPWFAGNTFPGSILINETITGTVVVIAANWVWLATLSMRGSSE